MIDCTMHNALGSFAMDLTACISAPHMTNAIVSIRFTFLVRSGGSIVYYLYLNDCVCLTVPALFSTGAGGSARQAPSLKRTCVCWPV